MAPLFVNDYSFHGQFTSPSAVIAAVRDLWHLRDTCRELGEDCFCSKILLGSRPATASACLREVIRGHGTPDQRALVLAWLDKHGPFWDTGRIHDAGDWYFVTRATGDEELATDSAVAECAARVIFDHQEAGLISVVPSDYAFTPLVAGIRDDGGIGQICDLPNHWEEAPLRQFLSSRVVVRSWHELSTHAARRFQHLVFAPDTFCYLHATPFSTGLRNRILDLLDILNQISAGTDSKSGSLNPEALELRESFFVGKKALFTDSSDSEKRTFKLGLTFICPIRRTSVLFPWHGKIKMGDQFKIHFAWPKPDPAEGIPVVYIGPKITKR